MASIPERMAGRMAAAPGPPLDAMPMGPEAAGPPMEGDPQQAAQQLQEVLAQAMLLIQQLGPQAFPTITGPIVKGFYAKLDAMIAPVKAAGQQMAQAGTPAPEMGPPTPGMQ